MQQNGGGPYGVQDSLERRPEPRGGIELEPRNLRVERRVVVSNEVIVAFHVAARRLQNDEALVLVDLAGRNDRLLADHAFALHLAVLTDGIVNPPPSAEQLRRQLPDVFDADVVREHVVPRVWARLLWQVRGSHGDSNAVRFSVEEGAR